MWLCIPKHARKCSQCMQDLTVHFSHRQQNKGTEQRTTRPGHKHCCCWASALVSAAVWSPEGYHKWLPLSPPSEPSFSCYQAVVTVQRMAIANFKRQIKHQITHGKVLLPLPLTSSHKRMQSAVPSPTLATMNEQNSWLLRHLSCSKVGTTALW